MFIPMESLSEYCAEGTIIRERMEKAGNDAELRVISFTPAIPTKNPAIVFVAGWISQMDAWKSVLQEMTKDFPVLYIETREKISSRMSADAEYSIEAIGSDIVQLIEQWKLPDNEYFLAGSSLGATVIVESYHALKSRPAAIVLISPNAVFRVPMLWKVVITLFYPPMYLVIKPFVKFYLKHFRMNVQADGAQYKKYSSALDGADPWKLKKAVIAVSRYSIWHRLASLDRPVLLIGALQDLLHEPGHFQTIASKIPRVTVVDLNTNAETHSPRTVAAIRTFLAALPK
ncbi:MAG: alpha/beta fold hydrolase [Bacteroidota bacterium]